MKTTTPLPTAREPRIFTYKPIMYAWIGRKKGGGITLYSFELRNSLSQIVNRGVKPLLDFDYGLQSLQHLIEHKFKGQYNVARIYGLTNQDKIAGKIVMEYRNDQLVFEDTKNLNFSEERWIRFKENRIRWIQERIYHADIVYHIENLKQNLKAQKR